MLDAILRFLPCCKRPWRSTTSDEMRFNSVNEPDQLDEVDPRRGLSEPTALAEILRIAGGNLRLVLRLLTQILRILEVNNTEMTTKEIVTAAREALAIGTA
jgi:hypothetical protein